MAIGERIKRIRNFRKLTQAQLGEAVGLSDVRIRQYEIGNRTPKEDMIQELAKALDCNYRSIYEPSLYAAEDVMYALFELDEHYDMPLYEVADPEDPTEKHIAVGFNYSLLDDFLNTWKKKKEDLKNYVLAEGFEGMFEVFENDKLSENYRWFTNGEWNVENK